MFFKRKNIGSEFDDKLQQASIEEAKEQKKELDEANSGESALDKKIREREEKEKAVDESRKIIEQELDTKHYFHKRLLETLDLGLLANLDERRAKNDLHEAIVQLMSGDNTHPLSAEGRKRIIKQIEDEVFGLGPLEPLLADSTVSDILVNGAKSVMRFIVSLKLKMSRLL